MNSITDINTIKACILGHAVADALGVPVEFSGRMERDRDPVTDMRGHGTHNMPAGCWSDDTSMGLCALDSLAKDEFSWDDVMNNFGRWYYDGDFNPTGFTFDAGGTCAAAIEAYCRKGKDTGHCGRRGDFENGNGSLMRIIPFALYAPGDAGFIETASALTHAHKRSRIACVIYSFILEELIRSRSRQSVFTGIERAKALYGNDPEWMNYEKLSAIRDRESDSIVSGGYVVTTLEAALWCLMMTDSYRDCVLKAVNLGGDTDTVAAVAGGLAGALYGLDAIPEEWLGKLKRRAYIEQLCEKAAVRWSRQK